jgi:DNA gyrase/topoisomerase IV subunit A
MSQAKVDKYKEEKKKLKEEIDKYMKIVESDEEIDKFIISQLEEGKKKYGRKRQSMIIKEDDSNVSDVELLIGISESGYIKKIPLKGNTNIGSVGKTNSNITVLQVNNKENILVIDSTGNVVKVSISAIPDMEYDDIGVELSKFFSINGSIKGILELPSMEVLNVKDDMFSIIFITRNGLAKRVQLNEFNTPTGRKSGIQLNDGDEVASVIITNMGDIKNDIVICTDNGNGIRLPISEIRTSSASAKGVNMISLKDDAVSSASIIDPKKKLLFYITSQGKMKITEIKYFPTMKRKDDPLKLMPLNATEKLLGIESVNKSDVVMVYKKNSDYETVNISDIKISGRNYKGDKLVESKNSLDN